MEAFVPAVALGALVLKLIDFLRYIAGRNVNGVVTQLVVWVAGVVVILLFAQSDWANTINVGGLTLAQLNVASQIIAGLVLGSATSAGYDLKKAVDNGQSAAIPTLLGPRRDPPPA